MRLDAIRTIKSALTGMATSNFTDILEVVFEIDKEEVPDFEEEEDEPDAVPEEGLTTKETAESSIPVACIPSVKQISLLKQGFVNWKTQPSSIRLAKTTIFTLVFPKNTYQNEKAVNIPPRPYTCVTTQK